MPLPICTSLVIQFIIVICSSVNISCCHGLGYVFVVAGGVASSTQVCMWVNIWDKSRWSVHVQSCPCHHQSATRRGSEHVSTSPLSGHCWPRFRYRELAVVTLSAAEFNLMKSLLQLLWHSLMNDDGCQWTVVACDSRWRLVKRRTRW